MRNHHFSTKNNHFAPGASPPGGVVPCKFIMFLNTSLPFKWKFIIFNRSTKFIILMHNSSFLIPVSGRGSELLDPARQKLIRIRRKISGKTVENQSKTVENSRKSIENSRKQSKINRKTYPSRSCEACCTNPDAYRKPNSNRKSKRVEWSICLNTCTPWRCCSGPGFFKIYN